MWRLTSKIPNRCAVAVSGGADSLALLDFVARTGRDVTAVHYDHGTGSTESALPYIHSVADRYGVPLLVSEPLRGERPPCTSREAWWRHSRYEWLAQQHDRVLTAHNLNDQAETWLMSSITGNPRLIQNSIQWGSTGVYRPLLALSRSEVESYCERYQIEYWQDPANEQLEYRRVQARLELLPQVLDYEPGFLNMIKRKTLDTVR